VTLGKEGSLSDTTVRDQLARDRTHLANERTLLAYIRTALTLAAAGAGMIQFLDSDGSVIVGRLLIVLGVVTVPVGFRRYFVVRQHLKREDWLDPPG
jgi:putative membrane protein